jgi:hypothetical protein
MTLKFSAKSGAGDWTAALNPELHGHNGYDVVLFLDRAKPTQSSGWMLELAIEPDGSINGQITARPGYDPLAVFTCSQRVLKLFADGTAPVCVVTEGEAAPARAAEPKSIIERDIGFYEGEAERLARDLRECEPDGELAIRRKQQAVAHVVAALNLYALCLRGEG